MESKNTKTKRKSPLKKFLLLFLIIGGVVGFFLFSNNNDVEKGYSVVEKGTITQELFETGSTKKGEEVRVNFKEGGRIDDIFVKEGQEIVRGDVIATLDKRDLQISLREAMSALSSAEATLESFLAGASKEDIDVVSATVESAKTALNTAKNNLEKQKEVNLDTLREVHENTPTFLGEVFYSTRKIELGIFDLAAKYFVGVVVTETIRGRESRDAIRKSARAIETYKDMVAKDDITFKKKEEALKKTENELRKMITEIDNFIRVAESDFYKDKFIATDIDLIREYRRTVNGLLGDTTSIISSISSVNSRISSATVPLEGAVDSAEKALEQAQKELLRVKAPLKESDIRIRESAVEQAKARVELLNSRIKDTTLRSPVSGVISDVTARGGEVVPAGGVIATINPQEDIEIVVDVYEGDIAKISVGNKVSASFVAFPDRSFEGEVIFVNPTGRIVDGIIYYEIRIMLDEYPENVLPQMTVDVTIKTAQKDDVLLLPARAVYRKEGKSFVRLMDEDGYTEREVTVGISGEGRVVEIVEGLEEGDKVLLE